MPSRVTNFLSFQKLQGGTLPPDLAREYLKISRQALHIIAERKKVEFVTVRNVRHYGVKSLGEYKWMKAAREIGRRQRDKENLDM